MAAPRRVTLADVASRAGVSATTASYILNDRSTEMRIAPLTQDRVRQAARELGYRPNRTARNLRTARTKTIGLISDHVASGQYASQMLTGAGNAARACDHLLVIGETGGDPGLEAPLIEEMLDRQVDGIIYATLVATAVDLPATLRDQRVVLLNCFDPTLTMPSVLPDEITAGRTAARLVLDDDSADHVVVVGRDPNPRAIAGPRRLLGIELELAVAGSEVAEVIDCDWSVLPAHDATAAWLAGGGTASAFICLNDRIAMGVYQALGEVGIAIPQDVVVVSFDGSELATWLRPAVTSVELPFAELGSTAVDVLMNPLTTPDTAIEIAMPVRHGGSLRSRR